jgi:ferrous iron transport protein A
MTNQKVDLTQVDQQQALKALSDLPESGQGVVRILRGGDEFTRRMVGLGFTPGAVVTILQNYGRGPLMVTVRDTRVALGRGEALRVLIEAV